MVLEKIAFGLCVLFLICTYGAQIVASKNGDDRRIHGLNLMKLGLSLSACAYLFRIWGPVGSGPHSALSVLFCLAGTTFLWLGWSDHWKMQRESLDAQAALIQEKDDGPELQSALPPGYAALYSGLNSCAREVLCAAQEEALHRQQCCVDTDHLLLGLLRVPHCAASRILARSAIPVEKIPAELARQALPAAEDFDRTEHPGGEQTQSSAELGLTHRARQVLVMAEMEAHRFGKAFIGTEHLLLGLLLIGTGPAASALFEAGLTVDGIRRDVITARKK